MREDSGKCFIFSDVSIRNGDEEKFCVYFQFFVYVSTAYCHLEEKVLEEKGYPPYCDPHELIKTVEWMDDDIVDSMTRK